MKMATKAFCEGTPNSYLMGIKKRLEMQIILLSRKLQRGVGFAKLL
jgi:hypothetical protein